MTTDTVQQSLEALYRSDRAGLHRSRVRDVTLLDSGYETDVFAFSLEAERGGKESAQDLILRVYAGDDTSEKAAREFAVMHRLHEAGYPVPRVLAFERGQTPLGRPFVIMERIHGASLGSLYWSASADRRQEAQTLLFRLMVALHALEASLILPDSPLATSRDPYACLNHELSALSDLLSQLEGSEPPSLRNVLAWLHSHRETVPCERPVVVHGDFHYNNALLRADGAPYVIDWSNVRIGDYRSDLAWTRAIRWISRPNALADEDEAELELYARFAGKEVMGIAYFEVIAFVRMLLSDLLCLRFGAAHQGLRPGAEANIRKGAVKGSRVLAALLQARTGIPMPDLQDAFALLVGEPVVTP